MGEPPSALAFALAGLRSLFLLLRLLRAGSECDAAALDETLPPSDDNDGTDDVLVGVPFSDDWLTDAGEVWLVLGGGWSE